VTRARHVESNLLAGLRLNRSSVFFCWCRSLNPLIGSPQPWHTPILPAILSKVLPRQDYLS